MTRWCVMGRAVYGGAECGPARSGAAVAVCTQLVDSWPGPAPQYPAASRHTNTYTPAKQISTLSHSFRTVSHSSGMQTAAPGPGEAKHMPVFGLGRDTSGRDDNHNERLYGGRESKDSSIAALEAFQRDYLPSLVAGFPAPAPPPRLPAQLQPAPGPGGGGVSPHQSHLRRAVQGCKFPHLLCPPSCRYSVLCCSYMKLTITRDGESS